MSEIRIDLVGEPATLRCTLRAAKEINTFFGSFNAGFKRLADYDHAAYVAIVAFGLGKRAAEVENAVWQTGLPNLVGPLTDYLAMLANGGRLPVPTGTEGDTTSGED